MEELELICFKIISNVGSARSNFVEAIQYAKKGLFDEAKSAMKQGDEQFLIGHKEHAKLLQTSTIDAIQVTLLLAHAEDQLMSAESFRILANEFIELYQYLQK